MKVNRSFQFTGLCLYERGNVKYGFSLFLSFGYTTLNENVIDLLEIDSSQKTAIERIYPHVYILYWILTYTILLNVLRVVAIHFIFSTCREFITLAPSKKGTY